MGSCTCQRCCEGITTAAAEKAERHTTLIYLPAVAAVRQMFPTTILDLLIHVYDVCEMSAAAMRDVITDIVGQGAPMNRIRDIWMADIGPDVPDHVVIDFVEAVDAAFNAADS